MKLIKRDFINLTFIIFSTIISTSAIAGTAVINAEKYIGGGLITIPESGSVKIGFTGFVIKVTGSHKPDKSVLHLQNDGHSDNCSV